MIERMAAVERVIPTVSPRPVRGTDPVNNGCESMKEPRDPVAHLHEEDNSARHV